MNQIKTIKYYGFSREAKLFLESTFGRIFSETTQPFSSVADEVKQTIKALALDVNTSIAITTTERPLTLVCVGVGAPTFLLRQDPQALAQFVQHRYSITPHYDFATNTITIPSSFLTFAHNDLVVCVLVSLIAKAFFVGADVSPNPDALALLFCSRLLNQLGLVRDFIYEFSSNNALALLDGHAEKEAVDFAYFTDTSPNPNVIATYQKTDILHYKSSYNLVSALPCATPLEILTSLSKSLFALESLPFTDKDSYVVAYIDSATPATIRILRRFRGIDQRLSLAEGWVVLATHKVYME